MKKSMVIYAAIAIIIVIGVFILFTQQPPQKKPEINSSTVLTASEAYQICNEKSCPTGEVYIQGNMSRISTTFGMFSLSDGKKSVYINLGASNLSLIDVILFHEKTFLQKDGIVEVKLKGKIYHDVGMCIMSGCQDMVNMIIEPNETEVIKKMGCRDAKSGKTTLEGGDCFDVSYRKQTMEDAYAIYFSSSVCTQEGRRPSGSFTYNLDKNIWMFGVNSNSRPGGCTEYCEVSEDRAVFQRQCAVGAFGQSTSIPENVTVKSLDILYSECQKTSSDCDTYLKETL